ncbi:putative bifunctional diguanylate cyclase/phosphodiesterase [Glaciecola sp. 2405UD65-10]|uniref:putative bifunctional diguanylate cyclase/phosphodiesterase n=1 Tax=Glaciecola sp. 2405UD65-10 TaxID=3397244 RepID=UPI003B5C9CCF
MKLKSKLSFTLGIRSLALLVCLGLVMAFLQTFFDFKQRQSEVKTTINAIVSSSQSSASNAVFLLEEAMAMQVITGLANFEFFSYIAIINEQGNVMAEFHRDDDFDDGVVTLDTYNPFLSFVSDNLSRITVPLTGTNLSTSETETYGEMVLVINNHIALLGVYERAVRTFSISIAGYILLTLALSYLYHFSLAAPLIRLSKRFQRVNTKSIATQKISHLIGHERNEFSLIVNAANDMLYRISSSQVLLTERSQRFRLILDTAPALIFSLDNHLNFVFANKATATFYGYSIYELKGRSATDVIEPIDVQMMSAINDFISSTTRQLNEILHLQNASQANCYMEVTFVKFKTPEGHSILVTATDVTKRVQAEEKIESLAYFDPLTTLPNRNKVYEVLNQQNHKTDNVYGIAAIADLDQFKRINDTLSHSTGDQLIVKLANRLRNEFSFSDLIARLGADEFLCIEEGVSNDLQVAKNGAEVLGERLRSCISKEIEIGLHSYALSASVGVVVYKKNKVSADEILQYADTAMYESKRAGRNCVTLFRNEMATQAAELLQLERDIMKAMFKDEFFFVLQPLIDSTTQELKGAEALMRWRKGSEIVNPGDFIPFLEESALIVDVGERILSKVCAYIKSASDKGILPSDFKIAVNISVKQLARNDFIETVSKVLTKHGVKGSALEFEITESVALNNMVDTIAKIKLLRKMGIGFSLDDFGTGYSSLSHLKDLPVDKLKIDRSFINDITVDKQDENLVRSIIQLSKNLGLVTVAEGVETQSQVEWLMLNGEVLLQGYYFSRPIEPNEFENKYFDLAQVPQ